MCGIAGHYAYSSEAHPVDREALLRTRDSMTARGPDGAGVWFSGDGRLGLAHRRLAIIDLTEAGTQPMRSADGRYVVTFNGEIYNYPALRASLEREGVIFRSHSDTEVLLHLYRRDGPAMVKKLRGMFAFALWDSHTRNLFLARDPHGIKPLYYADDGKTFRFASQVAALKAGGDVDLSADPAGAVGFLLWGSVPEPFTKASASCPQVARCKSCKLAQSAPSATGAFLPSFNTRLFRQTRFLMDRNRITCEHTCSTVWKHICLQTFQWAHFSPQA
jgi:asparagine synthase (glutamine-hydrolysing)